jgi:hypothetical protein
MALPGQALLANLQEAQRVESREKHAGPKRKLAGNCSLGVVYLCEPCDCGGHSSWFGGPAGSEGNMARGHRGK